MKELRLFASVRRFAALGIIVGLAGCYVPPVWDFPDAIYHVDEIKKGSTTKDDIRSMFGVPADQQTTPNCIDTATGRSSASCMLYEGYISSGIAVSPVPAGVYSGERKWFVWIGFDSSDKVDAMSYQPKFHKNPHLQKRSPTSPPLREAPLEGT